MDRAGLVGADGPIHCGAFDTNYMACLPNMVVMAPADEAELIHMVVIAAAIDDKPSCFRYPRGNGIGAMLPPNNKGASLEVVNNFGNVAKNALFLSTFTFVAYSKFEMQIGKGRILQEGTRIAILGYGTIIKKLFSSCSAS